MPIQNFAKDLIGAYNVGLQEKIEKARIIEEQKRYEQEQKNRQTQIAEAQKRWEADFKARDEQYKLEEKDRQLKNETAKLNIKLAIGSKLSSGELKYPTSQKGREMFLQEGQETPDPYQVPELGIQVNPNEVESPEARLQRIEAEKRAAFAPTMEMQQLLMGGRNDLETIRSENRREIEALRAQNRTETTLARIEGMASRGGGISENSNDFESLIEGIKLGGVDVNKLDQKTRLKLTSAAASRGILIQSPKFIEESKKLGSTAQFVQLAQKALRANPQTEEDWARLSGTMGALYQQIGTLGAQFPALGRLSDNDIKLLQSGIPTSLKNTIMKKLFPTWGTTRNTELEDQLVKSFANQIKQHLANAATPEEKVRLTRMYGLYVPGMEKYTRGGK